MKEQCRGLHVAGVRAWVRRESGESLNRSDTRMADDVARYAAGHLARVPCRSATVDDSGLCRSHKKLGDLDDLLPVFARLRSMHERNREDARRAEEETRQRQAAIQVSVAAWERRAREAEAEERRAREAERTKREKHARRYEDAARRILDHVVDLSLDVESNAARIAGLGVAAEALAKQVRRIHPAAQCSATTQAGHRCTLDAGSDGRCRVHGRKRSRHGDVNA